MKSRDSAYFPGGPARRRGGELVSGEKQQVWQKGYLVKKKEDNNTRYFIDLDLKKKTIIGWDYGQRHGLPQELPNPRHKRIFITKGQYNKLRRKD
ncbi:MAG: hypothetical protein JW803_07395 [Endomicrobiales bacterium]|nr:hypothetical protein [Endomicrobiales bacterium]